MEDAGNPPSGLSGGAPAAAPVLTARVAGLVACTRCGAVHRPAADRCSRCGSPLQSRDAQSLQRVWAWLFAGLIAFIPANLYPMLVTRVLGQSSENTIIGGVIELLRHGEWPVAGIVFFASVMIPVGKFIAISYLALSVQRRVRIHGHARQRLYEVVEFIGRWSMVDVFVVAILSALVRLGFVVSISPGIAAISFALSVAFTMLSAQNFDPRLIWDSHEGDER